MELNGAKILYTIHTNIPLLGDFKITQTLVSTWIVMALLSGFAIWLGHDLKLENVSKRQAAAEFIVTRLEQFVHDNMGFHFDQYIPLVGAIFALSIGCNLISVVGLWSPTADLNTEAAWAIVVFVLIMYYKIKTNGILSYLKGLLDPIFIMAPINVLSEVSTPVSMAFRHFGNILSGTVISTLLYWALASLSHVLFGWLPGVLGQIQLFVGICLAGEKIRLCQQRRVEQRIVPGIAGSKAVPDPQLRLRQQAMKDPALLRLLRPLGEHPANLCQAVLFAALHGTLTEKCYALGMGLIFGWAAEQTDSPAPGVVLHILNNGAVLARCLAERGTP